MSDQVAKRAEVPLTEELFCHSKIINEVPGCSFFQDIEKIIAHVKDLKKGICSIVSPELTSTERTALLAAMEGGEWSMDIALRGEHLVDAHTYTPYVLITLRRK